MTGVLSEARQSIGPEWLGEVPRNWSVVPLKRLATLYAGGTPDRENRDYWDDGTIPWLNSGAVNQWLITDPSAFITEEGYRNSSAKWISKDALVMALAGQGKTKGMVAQVAIETTCNQSMVAIVPRTKAYPRFLLWWLSANYETIRNLAGGEHRDGLNLEIVGSIPCPIPSVPQQRAIADFLDHETARLDGLVAAQERVLGLLTEKRRALITRAVTRGLDPRAPLRDSGIPWLGKIPAHWEAKRLKFTSPEITVGIVVTPAKYYESAGVPCLRSLNIREEGLTDSDLVYISDESNALLAKSRVFLGDLVAVRSGQPGTTAVVDERFDGANCIDLIIIRRPSVCVSAFLSHFLNSQPAKMQFLSGSGGAIQQHFNIETAKDLVAPVPSLEEQRAIVANISAETAKLDALRAATERTIVLLKERRAALIAAAVTGALDVEGTA